MLANGASGWSSRHISKNIDWMSAPSLTGMISVTSLPFGEIACLRLRRGRIVLIHCARTAGCA
jgi:hypothetical protein